MAHEAVGEPDDPHGSSSPVHQVPGKDEERDRHEREGVYPGEHPLGDDFKGNAHGDEDDYSRDPHHEGKGNAHEKANEKCRSHKVCHCSAPSFPFRAASSSRSAVEMDWEDRLSTRYRRWRNMYTEPTGMAR